MSALDLTMATVVLVVFWCFGSSYDDWNSKQKEQ